MATTGSVKAKIQGLIDKSNEALGGENTDLTSAVDSLIGGLRVPQEKTVEVTENGVTEVVPDEGHMLSKVNVETYVANAAMETTLAFGDTPPEDTTKVWVKTSAPSKLTVANTFTWNIAPTAVKTIITPTVSLPYPLYHMTWCVYEKKIYLFGGIMYDTDAAATAVSNKILVFDTEALTVTELSTTLPISGSGIMTAIVGEWAYIFNPSCQIRFNVNTEVIEYLDTGWELPYKVVGTSVGTKVYMFAAANGEDPATHIYDTETGIVTDASPSPQVLYGGYVVAVGTKIYAFDAETAMVYDTEVNTWTVVWSGSDTLIDSDMRAAYAGGREIYIGGDYGNSMFTVFDICTNTCFASSLYGHGSMSRFFAFAGVDDVLYIIGGKASSGTSAGHYYNGITKIAVSRGESQASPGELQIYNLSSRGIVAPLVDRETEQINIGFAGCYKGNDEGVGECVDSFTYNNGEWQLTRKRY